MLNKFSPKTILLILAAGIGISAPAAYAQSADKTGYVIDARNEVAKSGFGLCWRTGYWTPAMAILECDPDLVAKAPDGTPVTPPKPGEPQKQPTPKVDPKTPVTDKVTISADALFDFDKATLRPEGKQALDGIAEQAKGINLEVIMAVGHADRIGKDAYNQRLSEKRAMTVKQYLVNKGIPADRVYAEGKGEAQPVTGDECKNMGKETHANKKLVACLQPDRRVDIEMIGTKAK